jgi:hypothetical protein
MMEIDLKQAQIFIRDGFSKVGAVNNAAGYAIGITSMAVDSFTGIIPTGTVFTLTGDTTEYEVLTHTETSTNTRSITFAPGLIAAAIDDQVITFSPHQLEVNIGDGNFTYERKMPRQYKKNRGRLSHVKNADEEQLEVNFDFVWEHIRSSTNDPVTIEEALTKEGNASTWVTSSADPCEPYAVDLVILYKPICENEQWEKLVFEDFRPETLNHNLKDGAVACKGACNRLAPTVTRISA